MKKWFVAILISFIPVVASAQFVQQPTSGMVWTYFGPTLGADWGAPPIGLPPLPIALDNSGPGATSFTGAKDYFRLSIGNYPPTSEFAGDAVANIGSVAGLVGAVVQPSNVSPTVSVWFGVAGYSACNTGVGLAGSCAGVTGNGVALAGASAGVNSLTIGLNGVATNSPTITNAPATSGFNFVNITGAEIDVNMMKLGDGSAPRANAVGVSIVGASSTRPSTGATDCNGAPCIADAIFINPMGLSPLVGWIDGIRLQAGSITRNGISLGAVCQATAQCSAAPIELDAYSAAGAGNLIHGTLGLTGTGFFSLNAPAGGEVALQVNAVNVLNVRSTSVTAAQPITVPTLFGGTFANSALTLHATSNGGASGDNIVLNAGTTFISDAFNVSIASFTNGLVNFFAPVKFPASATGAVTPAFTNAPNGCSAVVWVGPLQTSSPSQGNIYLAACHQ